MNQYRDLVNKLEAIQNRVNEGELDRMASQGMADQLPPGYTRTPQGQVMAPNPAGQAQAAGNAQDQADMQRLSNYTFQQATKNGPKKISNAQAAQQANQLDKVWEEGEELLTDEPVDECGEMPIMGGRSDQQDSVTMNVSMNGSGKGGIRDLLDVLRNIENAVDAPGHKDMIVGIDEPEMDEDTDGGFQSATTEPNPETAGVDAVTPTGDDLSSKGAEAPKVNGGGNPFVKEGLLDQLSNLYQEVKSR
jgi:hypothetical protein